MTRMILRRLLLIAGICAIPSALGAQAGRDATVRVAAADEVQRIRLIDETILIGRITEFRGDSAWIEGEIGTVTVARARIAEVRTYPATALRNGVLRAPDPNTTRLFFAPTGRMITPGEGYVANHMLFVMSGAGALSRRVTLGGGMTIFPLDNFADNLIFVTPKFGLVASERLNVAAGGLLGWGGGGEGGSIGVAYAVATSGGPDASVSFGAAWGMLDGQWSSSPVLMGGGNFRLSRRTAAITENYLFPGGSPVFMYGLRLFGDNLTADFALINFGESLIFPGFPFVGLAYHF